MRSFSVLLNDFWDQKFKKYDLSRPTCSVEDTNGVKIMTTYSSFVLQVCWHVDISIILGVMCALLSSYFEYFKYEILFLCLFLVTSLIHLFEISSPTYRLILI